MSHYEPYAGYKDSGVDWLGSVPEHWVVGRLRDFTLAISTGPFGTALGSSDYIENGVPVINPSHIAAEGCRPDAAVTVDEVKASQLAFWRLKAGDVVTARRGELGRAAVISELEDGWVCGTGSLRITPCTSKVHSAYIHAALQSDYARRWLELQSVGSTMPNLSERLLGGLPMAVPPTVQEQQELLSGTTSEQRRIDALIEKKTRFIELLREKRQALITQAVTRGLDPGVPMKDSGVDWLGTVPAHWRVAPLKFLAQVQTGVAKGKDYGGQETTLVPYLRVANVQDGFLDLSDVDEIEIPAQDLDRYSLRPGDVLMNEGGDFDKLGRGHVWKGEIEPCIHQNHVFAVRPVHVGSDWLNAFTSSAPAQFFFMGRSKQSTNLASISSSNLMGLPVPVPPEDEQARILADLSLKLRRTEDLVRRTERSIELLRERRAALITAAVTGQIDVRVAATADAQAEVA